jgi:hypothetical protein
MIDTSRFQRVAFRAGTSCRAAYTSFMRATAAWVSPSRSVAASGYRLNREKLGARYLFVEWDWADDPNFGAAIPLKLIEDEPRTDDDELSVWLATQRGRAHRRDRLRLRCDSLPLAPPAPRTQRAQG